MVVWAGWFEFDDGFDYERIGVFHKSIFFFFITLLMVYFLTHNNFQIYHKS